MSEIVALPPSDRMSVEQCLTYCARTHTEFADVLVFGVGHDGRMICRSNGMTRKDALWLLHMAMDYVRGLTDD